MKRRGEKEKETNGERNDVAVIVANASFQTMEVFLSTFSTRSKSNIAVNIDHHHHQHQHSPRARSRHMRVPRERFTFARVAWLAVFLPPQPLCTASERGGDARSALLSRPLGDAVRVLRVFADIALAVVEPAREQRVRRRRRARARTAHVRWIDQPRLATERELDL